VVSSILGQPEPPLGRRAVETSASANLLSSSQAFQTVSVDADSLRRISVPFQGRCPRPAACALPLPLAGTGRQPGRTPVLLTSSIPHRGVCRDSQDSCPTGNAACPARCCRGCSARGSNTQQQDTPTHATTHSPPRELGQQGPHLALPLFQTFSSFAKITTYAYSLA